MCAEATLQPSAHADRSGRSDCQVRSLSNNLVTVINHHFFVIHQIRLRSPSPQILGRPARLRLLQSERRRHHEERPQLRAIAENPQIHLRLAESVRGDRRGGSVVRAVRLQLQFGSVQGGARACGTCLADIARSGRRQSSVSGVGESREGADSGGNRAGHGPDG